MIVIGGGYIGLKENISVYLRWGSQVAIARALTTISIPAMDLEVGKTSASAEAGHTDSPPR